MTFITNWFLEYSNIAHWVCFGAILLAGLNLPVSIDIIMVTAAVLAATTLPEKTFHFFFALLIGSYFSAWLSYWFGRILGQKLQNTRFFKRILNPKKMDKLRKFYEKYGLWTLIIGRFIPCGVRNCLFMSTGMSKMSFGKFILRDLLACSLWVSVSFYAFFTLGQNYQELYKYIKTFNILVFIGLSVTVIGIIWYKLKKKKQIKPDDNLVDADTASEGES